MTDPSLEVSIPRHWYLLMKVSKEAIDIELQHLVLGLQIGNGVLVPIFILLGWFLGNYQVHSKYYKVELQNQAREDSLTGLYNRRYISELLKYNTDLATRQGGELALVYIDVNNLKMINDAFGHDIGDIMIKSIANAIQSNIRKTDIAARMGGDEFLIVLPDCSKSQLQNIMNRVMLCFEKDGMNELNIPWTLSWGSSNWLLNEDTIEDLISRADSEMYENKRKFKDASKN